MALPVLATLTGTFLDGNGDPCSGFVVFSNNTSLRSSTDNQTVSPVREKISLDENGQISQELYVTDDPDYDPVDFVWTVREVIDGRPLKEYNIQIPSTDLTPRLEDLAPAVVVSPEYESYALANHTHDGSDPGDHDHDTRYFTEAEVTTSLAGKANTSHSHDYAATSHNHDASYSATGHNHDASYSATAHTHDTRYYTETETDTLLAGKSSTSHLHDDRYFTETEVTTALSGKSDTSHLHDAAYAGISHNHNTIYYTETEVDTLLTGYATDSELSSHASDTTAIHGIADTSLLATDADVSAEIFLHNSDTTSVHGIADTSDVIIEGDARLTDARTPTAHNHAAADTNSGTFDIARVPTGTSGTTVALGNHVHTPTSSAVTVNATATAYHGTATVYDKGDGWIVMDGGIESTGTNNAGSTLVTIPAGFRPAVAKQFTIRHTGTSASTGTLSMTTGGLVSYNSAFGSGSQLDFVGMQWPKAP